MSVSNYDRHGMQNLTIETVKVLDRMPIPPFLFYTLFALIFGILSFHSKNNTGMNIEQLKRENLLKAMRKRYSERIEYDTDKEVTPVEKLTRQSKEYQEVITKRQREVKEARNIIRTGML